MKSVRGLCWPAAIAVALATLASADDKAKSNKVYMHKDLRAADVAVIIKDTDHVLQDSINVAERELKGKAVHAECIARDETEGAVCCVTLLVDNNRLVEAKVNSKTGKLLSQRDVETVHAGLMQNDFAMASRWQKASDLIGKGVINSENQNLGKVEDIVADANSGRILYGVLSFGGFMGMGDKFFAIPWASFELPKEAKNLILNVPKDRLKSAEGFNKEAWPNLADEQWTTKTYLYYDRTPYWPTRVEATGGGESSARVEADKSAKSYRHSWYQRVTVWQKVSDLYSKEVLSAENNTQIGKMKDLVIDPDAGRILFGIVDRGDLYVAVPWQSFRLNADQKNLMLNITKDQFSQSPGFSSSDYPNLADEDYDTKIFKFYGLEPYWTAR